MSFFHYAFLAKKCKFLCCNFNKNAKIFKFQPFIHQTKISIDSIRLNYIQSIRLNISHILQTTLPTFENKSTEIEQHKLYLIAVLPKQHSYQLRRLINDYPY